MNISLALEYYKKAAEAGFVASMVRLGELYDKGVAGDRNVKEAKKYLQMASDLGSKNATNYLKKLEDEG